MTDAFIPLKFAIIRSPAVVSPDANLLDAMAQMLGTSASEGTSSVKGGARHDNAGCSYLIIVDGEQVVGLLTERDVVRLALQQLPLAELTLRQILNEPPITIRESTVTDLSVVHSLFQQHQLSYLPVLDDTARLVGVISCESLQQALSATALEITPDQTLPIEPASCRSTDFPLCDNARAYSSLLDVLPVGIMHSDLQGICTYVSERYADILGVDAKAVVGQPWSVMFRPELVEQFVTAYDRSRFENGPMTTTCKVVRPDESQVWIYGQWAVEYDAAGQEIGFVGTATDISDRKRAESLLEDQYQILEKIAKAEPLQEVFQSFLTAMETYLPDTACSIILCQDGHLCHPFAPSLPKAYIEAVTAAIVPIAEGVGSCGTAAYRQKIVISTDISTDPLWQDFKHLVVPHGLKACWSMPVFGEDQRVLGVFGTYSREKRAPQPSDIKFVTKLATLAGIAIERDQSTKALQQLNQELESRVVERTAALQESEERWQLALKGANDGIWDWNPQTNQIFLSQRLREIRDFDDETLPSSFDDCIKLVHPEDLDKMCRTIEAHLAGESEFFEMEYRAQHRNGAYIWILSRAQAQRDLSGRAVRMIGSETDITQRKTAERALMTKQNHLEALLNNIPHMAWIKDEQSRYIAANQPCSQFCNTDTLVGKTDFDLFPFELAQAYQDDDAHILQSGQRQVIEEQICRLDGTLGWLETTKTPFRDVHGDFAGTVGIAADITDRKTAELALKASESKYQRITESVPGMIYQYKLYPDGRDALTYISPHVQQIYELEQSAVLQNVQLMWDKIHPDDMLLVSETVQASAASLLPFCLEVRLCFPEGRIKWVQFMSQPECQDNGAVMWDGVILDISDRKQAEAALHLSEARATATFEQAPVGFVEVDLRRHNQLSRVNPALCHMLGYTSAELVGMTVQEITHPDDIDITCEPMQHLFQRGNSNFTLEKRYVRKDGTDFWAETTIYLIRQQNGEALYEVSLIQDISEKKKLELQRQQAVEALRLSEARANATFDQAVVGIVESCLTTGNIIRTNTWFCQMTGYTVQEMMSLTVSDLTHPDDFADSLDKIQHLNAGSIDSFVVEKRYARKDKSYFWSSTTVSLIRNPEGVLSRCLAVVQDISDRKATEQKLLESQTLLRTVLDTFPLSVFWKDRDSRYIGVNQNFVQDAGFKKTEDIYGLTDFDMPWAKTEGQLYQADDQSVMMSDSPRLGIIETQIQADGTQVWLETNKLPLHDLDGHVIGVMGTYQDISDRKQAAMSLEKEVLRRSTVFNASPDGIHILNQAGDLMEANERFAKMLGYSPEEVSWLNVSDWDVQWSDSELRDILQDYASNYASTSNSTFSTFETLHRRKDRSVFPVEISVCSMKWNEDFALVCIARDISERKQAELDLKRTNQELARATRLKDEFLANMSHELRTPLNAILGMTEGLQDEVFGPVNDQQHQSLMTIEQSGSHLLELINEILDLAKIEAGTVALTYSAVSVTHLCQSSLTFIKQQSLEKGVQLHLKMPWDLPHIRIDERRIRQVFINLLNNAVKFTPSGGSVTLTVKPLTLGNTRDQYYLRFTVCDTGIGISRDELHRLFQPFIQIDSALNREYEGTGLGLALVKRIVELHGGQVTLTSEEGVGSCFTIDLPYEKSTSDTPSSETTSASAILPDEHEQLTDSPLILLAEDNKANIVMLSSYLQAKGYRIQVATTGQSAIDLAQSESPHVILMDIQMPDMDGLTAIHRIRQLPGLQKIPILVLTAFAMEDDKTRCLAAGADKYLSKPVKLKQLVLSIQELIT